MTQEALKLALEALYFLPALSPAQNELQDAAIEAIKEALRENAMREVQRLGQEIEQEPVAWERFYPDIGKPQLTTPPQRTWVGLTDEEMTHTNHHMVEGAYQYSFKQGAKWAESKLKERNT